MKLLLIGTQAEALEIYRNVLETYGICASVGDFKSPFDQYDVVMHLWPTNAHRLSKDMADSVIEQGYGLLC